MNYHDAHRALLAFRPISLPYLVSISRRMCDHGKTLIAVSLLLMPTVQVDAAIGSATTSNMSVDTRSSVATISGLTISSGTLSPPFATTTNSYTTWVPNATTSVTATPTVTDATATIKVNGTTVASGAASGSITLAVGTNTITTVVTAQDGTSTKTYTVTVTRDNAYSNWLTGYFTAAQIVDISVSGDNADPDHDGIPNLLEFVLCGNPALPNTTNRPTLTTTPVTGGQTLVYRYKRKLAPSGFVDVVEHAGNLSATWTTAVHGQNGVTITTTPVDAATEQVTVTIPSAGTSRFVRLGVTR